MEAELKKILKAVTLELRHLLEGRYDAGGHWKPGDLEQRLAAIGVRRHRESVPVDELGHLAEEDRQARRVVDAYLKLREQAGDDRTEAVAEFVRETAYTWANRLLALRCMEARELIDPVILQQEAYGGRSLEHHRLAQRQPELCAGPDDGLFAVLDKVFREQAARLPMLFDPEAPGITLRPSPAALKDCLGLLSLDAGTLDKYRIRLADDDGADADPASVFAAPDALGWAYQYWNTEEKDRVFERVRTVKGAKIAGADIIPATQLYTESYMVKFLVQNSLGATWLGMHPESKLAEGWEYYVKDADRAPVEKKPASEITFLDPACGSGHFLLEAFDLFYSMYEEEAARGWSQPLTPNPQPLTPAQICDAILTKNLFGIDIDARAVQIAEVTLWMKAAEHAFDYQGVPTNLVAATASHLKGEAWEEFLAGFEHEPSVARVLRKFAVSMEHVDEIGSLARPAEDLDEIIRDEHATWERQVREQREANFLFPEMRNEALSGQLLFHEISDDEFGHRLFNRARMALDGFTKMARERGEFDDQMLAGEALAGFRLLDLLGRQYDVVAANPPYMGMRLGGKTLTEWTKGRSEPERRDLYGAMFVRALSALGQHGRLAFLTPHSWMFLSTFEELRERLLTDGGIETMAHLGPRTFPDLSNSNAFGFVMFVWAAELATDASGLFFRLVKDDDKISALRSALKEVSNSATPAGVYRASCALLSSLPSYAFFYWAPETVRTLFQQEDAQFRQVAAARQGLITGDNSRFLRFWWEIPHACPGRRWRLLYKGGPFRRWHGNEWYCVDWGNDGVRIKHNLSSSGRLKGRPQNTSLYGRPGATWTAQSSYGFSVRRMREDAIFSDKGPAFFVKDDVDLEYVMGICNSWLFEFLFIGVQPTVDFGQGYLERLPLPEGVSIRERHFVSMLSSAAIATKSKESQRNPIEYSFTPRALFSSRNSMNEAISRSLEEQATVCAVESALNRRVNQLYRLGNSELSLIERDRGVLFLFYPFLGKSPPLPVPPELGTECISEFTELISQTAVASPGKSPDCEAQIEALFASGLGDDAISDASADNDDESDGDDEDVSRSVPVETFLERVSQQVGVHPLSACEVIRQGISSGWRSLPEERRLLANQLTIAVHQLLGHRWPMQIEAGEPVPACADPDGIIPITPLAQEATLFERVQALLAAVEIDASDFAEVMGKPLDAWLATEFFKHHTKQFKKRPIAWQLQSGKFTARKAPAFACLVYYHKLDADTLPKIRTQYVGPLRQRLETELRGIEAVAADARSDRQAKRRVELEEAIDELVKFDAKLEQVAREGFATPGLEKLLEGEPLDRWCSLDGKRPHPTTLVDLVTQESAYAPDINDGVRVNIAPLQKAGLLAADVLAKKDLDKAIADRAAWRSDERRWVREQKLPQPGWWPDIGDGI